MTEPCAIDGCGHRADDRYVVRVQLWDGLRVDMRVCAGHYGVASAGATALSLGGNIGPRDVMSGICPSGSCPRCDGSGGACEWSGTQERPLFEAEGRGKRIARWAQEKEGA